MPTHSSGLYPRFSKYIKWRYKGEVNKFYHQGCFYYFALLIWRILLQEGNKEQVHFSRKKRQWDLPPSPGPVSTLWIIAMYPMLHVMLSISDNKIKKWRTKKCTAPAPPQHPAHKKLQHARRSARETSGGLPCYRLKTINLSDYLWASHKKYRMKTKALVVKIVAHLDICRGSSFLLVKTAEHILKTPIREIKFFKNRIELTLDFRSWKRIKENYTQN